MDPFKMVKSFLNPDDAYGKAQEEAARHFAQVQEFLKPYRDYGLDQYPQLNEAIKKLLDPTQLQNEWASKYETSPYAKRMLDMSRERGMEDASSMGLMGSSAALSNLQQGAADITSKDRQQYLNDIMNKYMSGLGLSSNIYGQGAGAATSLGNFGMQHGQNMAGLEYGKQAAPGALFGKILGMAISGGMGGMGGGGMGGMGGFGGGNSWNF